MSKWGRKLGKHRFLLIFIGLAIVAGASLPPFMTASCLTRPQTPEQRALDSLRNMTRGDVLPSEDVVARIEAEFPRSKAGALARILRARIKLNAKDYLGAAGLLDAKVIRDQTSLADYVLFLQAGAYEQAQRNPEARALIQAASSNAGYGDITDVAAALADFKNANGIGNAGKKIGDMENKWKAVVESIAQTGQPPGSSTRFPPEAAKGIRIYSRSFDLKTIR